MAERVVGIDLGTTNSLVAFMEGDHPVIIPGEDGVNLVPSVVALGAEGQVYVGNASTDPVGWIGASDIEQAVINGPVRTGLGWSVGLGNDPSAESFGATRFHAEVAGSGLLDTDDHSYYYTMGSESLYGMAAIASGHGDALGELGMLAGERTAPTIGTPDRLPTPFGEIQLPTVDVPLGPAVIDPEVARAGGSVTSDHKFDGNPI